MLYSALSCAHPLSIEAALVFLLAGWMKERVPPEKRYLNACAPGILPPSFEEERQTVSERLQLTNAPSRPYAEPEPEPELQLEVGSDPQLEPEPRGVW